MLSPLCIFLCLVQRVPAGVFTLLVMNLRLFFFLNAVCVLTMGRFILPVFHRRCVFVVLLVLVCFVRNVLTAHIGLGFLLFVIVLASLMQRYEGWFIAINIYIACFSFYILSSFFFPCSGFSLVFVFRENPALWILRVTKEQRVPSLFCCLLSAIMLQKVSICETSL